MEEKQNIFDRYAEDAEKRARDQQRAESAAKGQIMRKRGVDATTMTLSISKEDKQILKTYAVAHQTTASDLLHDWICAYCKID